VVVAGESNVGRSAAVSSGPASWLPFLRDFWHLAGPFWRSSQRVSAWTLTLLLTVLTMAQVALAVGVNIWNQHFFDAIGAGALDLFMRLILIFVAIVLANVAITVTHLQVKRRWQVAWREWLTERVIGEWMAQGRHYQLGQALGSPDNPDGRIAEDIRIATEYAIDLAHSAFYSMLTLFTFVGILWSLSGVVTITLGGDSVQLPGHLVWIGLIYSLIGVWAALIVGRGLTPAANRRQTAEQDFRFGLARAREHTLGIALLSGEADERRRFAVLFQGAVAAWDLQTRALRNIFFYTSSWSLLSGLFPILVSAPRYIAGTITLGVLMQAVQALQQMTSSLSWPVDNLAKAADWRASVERVRGLRQALLPIPGVATVLAGPAISRAPGAGLELRKLSLAEADGRPVLRDLDLLVRPGERVTVTGPSSVTGKLFSAIAGLWPWASGEIVVPPGEAVFFMPQRPYLPVGALRDAVCYPTPPDACGDATIAAALTRVGLAPLGERLYESGQWERLLSAGEQQRLALARLLLHRPALVLLEDATEAIDPDQEAALLTAIEQAFPTATLVAINHRINPTGNFHRHIAFAVHDGTITVSDQRLG
jgi:putative ATP-binding cassette transporter